MNKPFFAFLALFVCTCLFGCSDDLSTSPDTVGEECLAGDTLWVENDEQFEITFYNQGANGLYFWHLVDDLRDEIAEQIDYREEPLNPDLFGSSIYQIWEYNAVRRGKTCALFEYKRLIPEDAPVLETKNFVVIVE